MLDVSPELVEVLDTVLPTYSEDTEEPVEVPCITYFPFANVQDETGDTLVYSSISFCIKVWNYNISDLMKDTLKVDEVMRLASYRRVSLNQMSSNGLYCNILVYRAKGKEFIEDTI